MKIYCGMLLLVIFVVAWMVGRTESDVFTSMTVMENVLSCEQKMLREVKTYLKAEEGKITQMKEFVENLEQSVGKMSTVRDVRRYLGNPVNSYLMLKRMSKGWKRMENMVEKDFAEDLTREIEQLKPILPNENDQMGAMEAIFRLQATYLLKSGSLARGVIDGVPNHWSHQLTMDDILTLGQRAYQKKKWSIAADWMETALDVYNGDDYNGESINETQVIDDFALKVFTLN